jgi:DNA-binding winged helix-turn-helix (wHTH) protein/tetratricopeptide (TPR) repeat protein
VAAETSDEVYRFDQFCLDLARGTLRGPGDVDLELRPKVYAALRYLVEHPGVLHRRDALLEALWPDVVVSDDSLTQCMSDLRRALGDRAGAVLRTLPRRGYVLVASVTRENAVLGEPRPAPPPPPAQPAPGTMVDRRRDSLILHPIDSPAGDAATAQHARALTAELISEIARFEGLFLIANPTALATQGYRLHCEVRELGGAWRLSARLEDAASGAVLWAHREEAQADTSPAATAGMANRLAVLVDQQVEWQSLLRARAAPQDRLTARELYLLGRDHHQRGTEADTRAAWDLFDRAIRADPDFALAYAWQAFTVQRVISHGWGRWNDQDARDVSLALARRAVDLAPDSPLCLSRLSYSLVLHQRWEAALDAARAALSTWRPAGRHSRITASTVLAHGGHPEEAVVVMQQALALNPAGHPTIHAVLGRALLLAGRAEEALARCNRCVAQLPDYGPAYHSLVVAAIETGRIEEARAALRELVRLRPGWIPRNHTGDWFFRDERDAQRFLAAFRAAGWVEAAS